MSETGNGFERVESALPVVIELAEQQVVDDDPEMSGEAHRQNRMIGVARKYMERIQREDYDPAVDLANHAKATVIGHALGVVWQMANEGALDPDDADDDALAGRSAASISPSASSTTTSSTSSERTDRTVPAETRPTDR